MGWTKPIPYTPHYFCDGYVFCIFYGCVILIATVGDGVKDDTGLGKKVDVDV
jgi:hypothetical protein